MELADAARLDSTKTAEYQLTSSNKTKSYNWFLVAGIDSPQYCETSMPHGKADDYKDRIKPCTLASSHPVKR